VDCNAPTIGLEPAFSLRYTPTLNIILLAKFMDVSAFYDQLSSHYHLLFPEGIDRSFEIQGKLFDEIIADTWGSKKEILDVSCGIRTQAIGLAKRGYTVSAADLSSQAVERARREASQQGVNVQFSVGDMRDASSRGECIFDVVLSADSAIQHLTSEAEILATFKGFYKLCRPGGGCIVTARDFEAEGIKDGLIRPYSVKRSDDSKFIIVQTWEETKPYFRVGMYFIEDIGRPDCTTQAMHSTYLPVSISRLMELLS
jgi:SAM-dependent methyltransferase